MLTATLPPMAKREQKGAELERFFVRAEKEIRRKLGYLAIDADSTPEKLGGQLLTEAVNRLWASFDPKRKEK